MHGVIHELESEMIQEGREIQEMATAVAMPQPMRLNMWLMNGNGATPSEVTQERGNKQMKC